MKTSSSFSNFALRAEHSSTIERYSVNKGRAEDPATLAEAVAKHLKKEYFERRR